MQQEINQNNAVNITGIIASEYTFSHEVFGEKFYMFYIQVDRLSENADILPVMISERLMEREDFAQNSAVCISGQIRSYNSFSETENRNRLLLTIFARDYIPYSEEMISNPNDVFLNGYVCKAPVYRTTPFGREIADILLAVNRSYNKSDYIPCIAWGRNARYAGKLAIGDNIRIWGRMQSRNYQKKTPDGEVVDKTAYEVSVSKLEFEKNGADVDNYN